MKRTILYSAFAVAAFSLGYTGTAKLQTVTRKAAAVASYDGEPCSPDGSGRMSGYMVSTGRDGGWECVGTNVS